VGDYKEIEDALSLVKELCTVEQIQNLLRTRKGQDNVRISAETKDDLVDRNLREAVEARVIDVQSVFDLIRAGEENGNQHIFCYRPKSSSIANALTFESVAAQLWKKDWEQIVGSFPAIRLKPNDYQFSDFRPHPTKPKDWILKIYGHTVITRATGKIDERPDGSFWKEFVEDPLRIILLARWNYPDLLEIKVQRNESRRRVVEWHNKVWEMLNPALVKGQFNLWELSKPMAQLITNYAGNEKLYSFRDASVVDLIGGVNATFQTVSDEGSLFESLETRQSIQGYLKANKECSGLTVTWFPQPSGKPQKAIRTLLAAKDSHEMVVLGHCSAEDLDYVADQLRRFSKRAS
jgi:hypothetical protein